MLKPTEDGEWVKVLAMQSLPCNQDLILTPKDLCRAGCGRTSAILAFLWQGGSRDRRITARVRAG